MHVSLRHWLECHAKSLFDAIISIYISIIKDSAGPGSDAGSVISNPNSDPAFSYMKTNFGWYLYTSGPSSETVDDYLSNLFELLMYDIYVKYSNLSYLSCNDERKY